MNCPLITAGFGANPTTSEFMVIDCLEEECAWWDIARQGCKIATLALKIELLTKVLLDIRDKMPHEE